MKNKENACLDKKKKIDEDYQEEEEEHQQTGLSKKVEKTHQKYMYFMWDLQQKEMMPCTLHSSFKDFDGL